MKKEYYIIAILLAAVLTSCVKEQFPSEITPLGENAVAFVLGGTSTKSADALQAQETGLSFPAGMDDQGNKYYLQETVETLNPTLATKGTPAYTKNVGKLYTTMEVYADGGDFDTTPVTFEARDMYDSPIEGKGQGWRYSYDYGSNLWPADDTPVDFYLNMPASPTGVSITDRSNKQITFDYSSPLTGAAQQDILFAQTSISKSQHDGYLPNGAPVMMYHALTGVKFRTGHLNDNATKTIITKVVIKGLKSTGSATFTGSDFEWDVDKTTANFSQEFTNQPWSAEAGVDGTVTYTSGENNKFGDTWYAAAADKNLNDEDGSLTFWFIPQEIDENVTMEVTFRVKTKDTQDGEEITHEIAFGEKLKAGRTDKLVWEAGQLRTYTLKPYDVAVKIVDKMEGLKKSDLHVTNTGNVDEYVRIMVIGNWYGWETEADMLAKKEPDIMVGYTTDGSDGKNVMVDPWFREDEVYGQYFDDSFKGGHPADGREDWVRGSGSYFYFTEKIGAGTTLDSATQALFQYYELPEDKIPTIYIPVATSNVRVPAWGVHLKMEIVVQAIGTTAPDGSEYQTCWAAWSAATGKEIKEKPYTDD
jgi:hypothetical protein